MISGGFGLTEAGAGTLALSSANTYTGSTAVNAGTLLAQNASAWARARDAMSAVATGAA